MDPRIEKTILFIARNFRRDLPLDTLAFEAGLSKFHFQRLFKKELGVTPLHYLNKIRIEHAAHLLVMFSHCTATDAAFESGYSSPAVFSRSFRNFYQMSPSQFQQLNADFSDSTSKQENPIPISVRYFHQKTVEVAYSNLEKDNLWSLFKKLRKDLTKSTTCFGIFVDTPIHRALSECRYYAGFESLPEATPPSSALEIEEGYYTTVDITGDFSTLESKVLDFKEKIIDPSDYRIASTIGFEQFRLPPNHEEFDYFKTKRSLFIKIERQ